MTFSPKLESDQIEKVTKALIAAKTEINHAAKVGLNDHTKKNYATLEACLDAVDGPFSKNNLVLVQQPTVLGEIRVLATTLIHESGQWLRSYTEIVFDKNTNPAQAQGSGITYVRRYALAAMAGIGQVDDDGHGAGVSVSGSKQGKPKTAVDKNNPENWKWPFPYPEGMRGERLIDLGTDGLARAAKSLRKWKEDSDAGRGKKFPDPDGQRLLDAVNAMLNKNAAAKAGPP